MTFKSGNISLKKVPQESISLIDFFCFFIIKFLYIPELAFVVFIVV